MIWKVEGGRRESGGCRVGGGGAGKHAGCSAWLLLLCLQGEQLRKRRKEVAAAVG